MVSCFLCVDELLGARNLCVTEIQEADSAFIRQVVCRRWSYLHCLARVVDAHPGQGGVS